MHIHIIDHQSAHLPSVVHLVTESLSGLKKITFTKTKEDPGSYLATSDLIILSGGTHLVHLNPGTHQRLLQKIVASGKPVFGICLGAEALAKFFGATLTSLPDRSKGIQEIEITNKELRDQFGDSVPVYEYHSWSIVKPPQNIIVDAMSSNGIELFHHKTLPIWGSQFHPETRRKTSKGSLLFRAAMERLKIAVKESS